MSDQQLSLTRPTARKDYPCIWCREKILKGERHMHEVSLYDGSFQDHRWHPECWEASESDIRKHGTLEFMPHEFKRGTNEEV